MKEKKIKENLKFVGNIIKVYQDDVMLENGTLSTRDLVTHPGAVAILPVKDNMVWLVKQFRYTYDSYLLEIPAGKLDPNELPEAAALRELKEETGLIPKELKFLGKIYPSCGVLREIVYLYYVDEFIEGDSSLDEGEFLDVIKISLDECIRMIESNDMKDAKTMISILKYLLVNRKI